MKNGSAFKGLGVAMVTPFNSQAQVDYSGLQRLTDNLIKGGVDYLVVHGTTGESPTLSKEEKRAVLDFIIEVNKKRVPVVLGIGGNNTAAVVAEMNQTDFDGVDGILSVSPSYNKPTQPGIIAHYKAVAEACPLPIILYNVPGRTQSNMAWTTTVRLARDSKKFIGIKEASGDLIQATRIIKNRPNNFFVTSGDDEIAMAMVACGGEGVISVMANAFPMEFSQMIGAALEYDFTTAQKINLELYDLHKWLYIEGNPVGIKSAMKVLGICGNEVRLPLHALSTENYHHLKQEMERIQRLIA